MRTRDLNLEMARRFRQWMAAQKYASTTVDKYYRTSEKLCLYLRDTPLSSVTPINITDFITATLPKKWNEFLVNDWISSLRCFFDFLYFGGVVDRCAPRFVQPRPKRKKLPRTLSQQEIRRLIRACKNLRDRAIVEVYYATGCRSSELLNVKVADVDFAARTIRVTGKRKDRIVYFGQPALKALRSYLRDRTSGYLFQDVYPDQKGQLVCHKNCWMAKHMEFRNGKKVIVSKSMGTVDEISRSGARARFKKYIATQDLALLKRDKPLSRATAFLAVRNAAFRANLGDVSTRTLRHCFATHLLEKGASVRAIQVMMGHTYLSSTEIYTRITNKTVASSYRRFHPRAA